MKINRFRVRHLDRKMLEKIDPAETGPFADKDAAAERLEAGIARLATLQERLYASDRYSMLLIFQGMDAAGKDSAISHVLSGANPQGTEVHSFRQPTPDELAHDFLWRAAKVLPARGRIGIFNRSYYEDVVTVRVNPAFLEARHLPGDLLTSRIWNERHEDINTFEQHLARSAVVVRKFYLHVSRSKQRKRLLERMDDPAKHWKFNAHDIVERGKWKQYRRAYADAMAATSRDYAPWYVVPADHKWFTHLVIAEVIVQALEGLDLSLPRISAADRRALKDARRVLEGEQ